MHGSLAFAPSSVPVVDRLAYRPPRAVPPPREVIAASKRSASCAASRDKARSQWTSELTLRRCAHVANDCDNEDSFPCGGFARHIVSNAWPLTGEGASMVEALIDEIRSALALRLRMPEACAPLIATVLAEDRAAKQSAKSSAETVACRRRKNAASRALHALTAPTRDLAVRINERIEHARDVVSRWRIGLASLDDVQDAADGVRRAAADVQKLGARDERSAPPPSYPRSSTPLPDVDLPDVAGLAEDEAQAVHVEFFERRRRGDTSPAGELASRCLRGVRSRSSDGRRRDALDHRDRYSEIGRVMGETDESAIA